MKNTLDMIEKNSTHKLLLKFSIPATIAILGQLVCNITDAYFVGVNSGVNGLAAISFSFPLVILFLAVAETIGVGSASIISRAFGAKEHEKVHNTIGNSISIGIIFSILISFLAFAFLNPIIAVFGVDQTIKPLCVNYLYPIFMGGVFIVLNIVFYNIQRATGNFKTILWCNIIAAILNIILDYILIFELNMGISGAAIATIIAQFTITLYLIYYFVKKDRQLLPVLSDFVIKIKVAKEILFVGFPSFIRQSSVAIVNILFNRVIGAYGGVVAVAVFAILYRILMLIFIPMFGLIQGLQPIAGYYYGAKKYDQVIKSFFIAVSYVTLFCFTCFLIIFIFPKQIIGLFTDNPDVINYGLYATRLVILAIPITGFQFIGNGFYQTLGKPLPSLILSFTRNVFCLIPCILILPIFFKATGAWLAMPATDFLTTIVTIFLVAKEVKLLKKLQLQTNTN